MTKTARHAPRGKKYHPLEKADLEIAHNVAGWRDHLLVRALGKVSELADQPQLYGICVATTVAGVVRRDAKLVRAGMRMLAAEWLATKAKSFVKHRIDRTRPEVMVDGGDYRLQKGHSTDTALNSFPSGHTAGAAAVARAYASEYPEHTAIAAMIAVGVGLIQLPRCKHYVTDISVGAAIGLAAGSLAAKRAN